MGTWEDNIRKKNAEKLEDIKRQLRDTDLKIRKMTKAERKKYPPQNRDAKKTRALYGGL